MNRLLLALWAVALIGACWRLDPASRPITGDNQLYFYLAERAASGVAPHVSLVDTKSELGVLTTATAIAAGRELGIDDVALSRAASIASVAACVVLAAELAYLLTQSTAAGHVAALAMMASRGVLEHAATGSNPKLFLAAFALLAHVLLAKRRRGSATDVAAGVAAGAAFLCWQPALLVVAAVAAEALLRGGVRRVLTVLGGVLVPVVGYELYFLLHGAAGEQLFQEYAMTLGSVHEPRRLAQSVFFVGTEARGMSSPLRVGPIAFAAVALATVVRIARERRCAFDSAPAGAVAFALAAAGALAFTLYDHQGVPDLFFVAPYFSVATGVAVAIGIGLAPRGALAVPLAVSLLLGLQIARDDSLRGRRGYTLADQRLAAERVREWAAEPGGVWVYEAVHLLGLAHLDNHVAYGLFYDDVRSVLDIEAWRPLRDGRMPGTIVHGRDGIPGSDAWLRREYEELSTPSLAAQGLFVWKRKARQQP